MNSNTLHPSLRSYTGFVCLLGYVLTVILCIAGPMILFSPEIRSAYFFVKIGWLVFLATGFWGSIGFFLVPIRRSSSDCLGVPRIAPGIAYVVTIYSVMSAILLLSQSLFSGLDFTSRAHLVVQLALFVVVAIIVSSLSLAVFFAPRSQCGDAEKH